MTHQTIIHDTTRQFSQSEQKFVKKIMDLAVEDWLKHINSQHPLTVELTIRDDLGSAAALTLVRATYQVPVADLGAKTLKTSVAAYKLAFGYDHNGEDPDIFIEVNAGTIDKAFYYEDPGYLYSIFVHELSHGLFLNNLNSVYSAAMTPIDRHIGEGVHGRMLGGHNLLAITGGRPVPFSSEGAHLAMATANAFQSSLGPYDTPGSNRNVTKLDVAIASDSGLPTKFDDTIYAGRYPGNLDAGDGNDDVFFDAPIKAFKIAHAGKSWTITNSAENYEIQLLNVETLRFSDGWRHWTDPI